MSHQFGAKFADIDIFSAININDFLHVGQGKMMFLVGAHAYAMQKEIAILPRDAG